MGRERRSRRSDPATWARRPRRPNGLIAFALALVSLATVGCGGRGASQDAVRVAIIGHIDSLSPIYDRAPDAVVVQQTQFRGFLQWTANGALRADWAADVPSAAQKTFRGNAKTASYTMRLRPNAVWSDGSPLTFDDFLFAYRVLLHPLFRKGHEWWTAPIRGFTQAGDTLTFTIDRSVSHDGLDLFPLPHHALEDTLNRDTLNFINLPFHQTPLSDGPYEVKRRSYNSVELARNPSYAPRPAQIERLVFQFYPTPEDAMTALSRNDVDVIDRLPPEALPSLPQNSAIKVDLTPGPRLVCLVFNTRGGPFRDARLRQALAHAAERTALVSTVGKLGAIATDSWLQPTRLDYSPSFADYKGDLEASRKSLAQSGWRVNNGRLAPGKTARERDPVELRLLYDKESTDMQAAATALQKSWQRLGLVVTLDGRSRASAFTDMRKGTFTVALQALEVYPWTEPTCYFDAEAIPTERNNFHGDNVAGWTSKANQQLLRRIVGQASPAAVPTLVNEQERAMAREVPLLPLYFTPHATAFRDGLSGLAPRTFGGITWNVEEWSWR